jgi:hypothetical protein
VSLPAKAQTNDVSDYLPDHFSSVTNIALIPYVKYDLSSHTVGYGAAALYKVTDNFWTGLRADRIDGRETTAGVQAQLQTTFTWAGVQVTPFLATSVGLGQDSLYGAAGPGAFLHVFSHTWRPSGHDITLNVEVVGDYEHVVSDGRNSDQVNAGPILNLKF